MFWDLDDAVKGVEDPMSYKYMKFIRFILRMISGWPGKELGESTFKIEWIYNYYNSVLSAVFFVMIGSYLIVNTADLTIFETTHMYITLLMNTVIMSRCLTLCISKTYRKLAAKFVREMHLFHHKDKSEYSMKVHILMHRISHYFTIYYGVMTPVALLLFDLTPVYNNFKSGKYETRLLSNSTYEHAVYLLYPFNSDTNFNGYIVATIFNAYGTFLCVNGVCMFDLFLSLMVFSLYGHFKVLLHLLATFPLPAGAENYTVGKSSENSLMYSESELKLISQRLKQCIEYHRFIYNFITEMSSVFGYTLMTYFIFHQVSGCLLLLQCSQLTAEALSRYAPFTILMFGELIQLSIIFESIGTMSGKLKDAVYGLPWEYMDTGNRKTVFIYLLNVQEPILINAAGFVYVGVKTMASILKTSFSYFFFLRTFENVCSTICEIPCVYEKLFDDDHSKWKAVPNLCLDRKKKA